jgi:hypothetical protein
MLNGAEDQKPKVKEPTLKRITINPKEPTTFDQLTGLRETLQDPQYIGLSIFIEADVTEPLADKLRQVLPTLETPSISIQINDCLYQDHYSKIIEIISRLNCQNLSLDMRMIPGVMANKLSKREEFSEAERYFLGKVVTRFEMLLTAVKENPHLTSFSLSGTRIAELVDILSERLQAFSLAKKGLSHLGLRIARLPTQFAALIIQVLGPLGLRTLDFALNDTCKTPEGFEALCQALLNPNVKLEGLVLSLPLGGVPGNNQTKLLCDTLTKIPHNFDLTLRYGVKDFHSVDLAFLKEALFLNPRLCISFYGLSSPRKPFEKEIDAILRLSEKNYFIRSSSDQNAIWQRYNSLVLSGYTPEQLADLAIKKEVGFVPTLKSILAKFVAQNAESLGQELKEMPTDSLESLPSSQHQYDEMLLGFQNLRLSFNPETATQGDYQKLELDKRSTIFSAFKVS